MEWPFVYYSSYLLQFFGVISNLALIKLVAFKSVFDWYCRIGIFLLAVQIIGYLLSYAAQIHYCVTTTSSMFKTPFCMEQGLSRTLDFLYTLSAMLFFTTQSSFTVERIVSIRHPKFHNSRNFRVIFTVSLCLLVVFSLTLTYLHSLNDQMFNLIYGITTQVLTISTFPLTLVAMKFSRKIYQADVSTYDLGRKHQLFNSFEITRSIVFALLINYGIQVLVFSLQLMWRKGLLWEDESFKMEFIVQMLWNTNHIIFPWSVILFHRGQRAKLIEKWKSIFPTSHLESRRLTNVDGKPIVLKPTQNDYFHQMRVAWTTEHKF